MKGARRKGKGVSALQELCAGAAATEEPARPHERRLLGGKRTSELTLEFRERGVQEIELIFIGDLSLGCLQEIRRPLCCE